MECKLIYCNNAKLIFHTRKEKNLMFLEKFKKSKISGIYEYCAYFGNNSLNSFGKVVQAQIIIAFANTTLSIVMLFIL